MTGASLSETVSDELREPLSDFMLSLGDDALILGHRLSEWCGHAPALEEDIALANIALDEIGRANVFLMYAGELEGRGRNQDKLAYFRNDVDYRNLLLVEQPNKDFGYTIARQFLFDAYALPLFETIGKSKNEILAGLGQKAVKEIRYHLRHSRSWIIRLGDGTELSKQRIQAAIDDLWLFTGEILEQPLGTGTLVEAGLIPESIFKVSDTWRNVVSQTLEEATLKLPDEEDFMVSGGRRGIHSEHLGYILAEMQILARSHPEASW